MNCLTGTALRSFCFLLLVSVNFTPRATAQSKATTSVDSLGIITANQASGGLGFGLDPEQDWQWAAAAAAGATHARMQCSWESVEQQSAPPLNKPGTPQYLQTANCLAGFASAKKYGIHPTVVAAYGSPHHQILTVMVPGGAPAGATSLNLVFASGTGGSTLAKMAVPYDYFGLLPFGRDSAAGAYYGTYISGITLNDATHATISLASALSTALPADNTLYAINEVLYPSAATSLGDDPSVVAYGNYVAFLAGSMAANGVTGEVELWNEPPSAGLDPWDNRYAAFDNNLLPAAASAFTSPQGPNYGFVANLQNRTLPPGITLVWNGTSGNGSASILGGQMLANTKTVAVQPAKTVSGESFHPYGGAYSNPEEVMWSPPCMQNAIAQQSDVSGCGLSGERVGPNILYEAYLDGVAKAQQVGGGVGRLITETNILAPAAGLNLQQARFVLRQYLGFQALGYTPIEFFKLFDADTPTDPNFSFLQQVAGTSTYTPKANYTALAGLMSDLEPIRNMPVTAYPATKLATVTSYQGTYALTTAHLVGSRSGASSNSDLFVVWQRSTTPCAGTSCTGDWMTLTSPAPAPVMIALPLGSVLTSATNLTTRASIPFTLSGQGASLQVADDPIGLLIDAATVSIPILSPVGGTYSGTQLISIADATAGATIYYTLDGSMPTTSSMVYTGPVSVAASQTITTFALCSGNSSAIATAIYSITAAVAPTPTFTPAGGTYTTAQLVTVSSTLAGASIRYTLDGSTPTSASTLYTGPIAVAATSTINAVTIAPGFTNSPVATTTYLLNLLSTFVVNQDGTVNLLDSGGAVLATAAPVASSTSTLGGIAIDQAGDAWAVTNQSNTVNKVSSAGDLLGGYTGGGVANPVSVAIDGLNRVFIANTNDSYSVFSNAGAAISPATGYRGGQMAAPSAIRVDQTGSVWISNATNSSVTRVFGGGAPTTNPLVMGEMNGTTGTRP